MGSATFPHEKVSLVMQKYLDRLQARIIEPATAELKKLATANPNDKVLQKSVKFATQRMAKRNRRINSLFKSTAGGRRKSAAAKTD